MKRKVLGQTAPGIFLNEYFMKILNSDTSFHWRNYLRPTPPTVFWIVTTIEAIVLTLNGSEIVTKGNPTLILILLLVQTAIGKSVMFFGKIKDEYEQKQKVTVEATGDITVKKETIDVPKEE